MSATRNTYGRCVCGHLLFIHTDEDRRVRATDEPPYVFVTERRGECMHADCGCMEPHLPGFGVSPASAADVAASIAAILAAIDEATASDAA